MQYIVTQKPKPKFRGSLCTAVAIVEAKSAAEAIRVAQAAADDSEKWFDPHPDFNKPQAEPLTVGAVYRF